MKKIIIAALMAVVLMFAGCNGFKGYDWIDTNYSYDYAIIAMPDGTSIKVEIKKWADSEYGEQLTITAKDGTVYLVSSVNCVLVKR